MAMDVALTQSDLQGTRPLQLKATFEREFSGVSRKGIFVR